MECFRRKFYGKIFSAYRDIPNLPNFVALSEEKTPQEVMKMRNLLPRDPIWKESGQLNTQKGSEAFNLAGKNIFSQKICKRCNHEQYLGTLAQSG